MAPTFLAHHFLARLRLKMKKASRIDASQSKILMQRVLGLPELDFKLALEIVSSHQERTYCALLLSTPTHPND
jgi:hypothetical protein